ncbi:MAG: hypothetical protein AAF416_13975 [Pseudomonadota bacterium]
MAATDAEGDRSESTGVERWALWVLVAVSVVWVGGALFIAPAAPFIIDGYIFLSMSEAFAERGSLFLDNGYADYGNPSLRVLLTRTIDGELVPQYPGLWGVLSAPAYLALGARGVMLMNALASIASVFAVWRLGILLFADRKLAIRGAVIFAVATYAVDYATGIWPQAVGAAIVIWAYVATVASAQNDGRAAFQLAGIAGLLLGIGVALRADILFSLPAAILWLLTTASRPYGSLAAFALGLVPGLGTATAINEAKFGVLSPMSYGVPAGNTSLEHWVPFLPFAVIGLLAALLLGLPVVRRLVLRPVIIVLGSLAALSLGLALEETQALTRNLLTGIWALVVDLQTISLDIHGTHVGEDGVVTVFGVVKKSLLHSLPYLAGCIVLLPRIWRGPDQKPLAFCLLVSAAIIAPFALTSWHGGPANQVRYFLTILPVLALAAAAALREIAPLRKHGDRAGSLIFAIVALLAGALPFAMGLRPSYISQNIFPWALVDVLLALGVAILIAPHINAYTRALRGRLAQAMWTMMLVSFATATVSAWMLDMGITQKERLFNSEVAAAAATLPEDALVVSFVVHRLGERLNTPGMLTIQGNDKELTLREPAHDLVRQAAAEGRQVIAHSDWAVAELQKAGLVADAELIHAFPPNDSLYRITLPEDQIPR